MHSFKKLLKGYKQFYQKYFVDNPNVYKRFKRGQKPHTLIIACSDSRVDPFLIFNAKPGELFVVRNIANIVPPYEDSTIGHHGVSACIEFAVNVLKVESIVIMGHGNCGGIKHLCSSSYGDENSFLDRWVEIIKDAKLKTKNQREIEKESVKISLNNLKTFPFIDENKIKLIGCHFDLKTGKLSLV